MKTELFWIAEHYSVEADLCADGDKWAWLNPPSPAKETEWLARAQGSGRCREGDTQWTGDLPNEQTCLRFEIMLSDTRELHGDRQEQGFHHRYWLVSTYKLPD